jgi:hypothetical protein
VYEFRFSVFKRSFVFFRPLDRYVCSFVEGGDVLKRRLARRTEVSVVDEAISPADEHSNGLESAEEAIDGDEEYYNRQSRALGSAFQHASKGYCTHSINDDGNKVMV